MPSNPRVSVGTNPQDDVVWVTTSEGQILAIEPPLRDGPQAEMIFWRQLF